MLGEAKEARRSMKEGGRRTEGEVGAEVHVTLVKRFLITLIRTWAPLE